QLEIPSENFQKASELAPNFTTVYKKWGDYHYQENNYSKAIIAYEKLLDLSPPYWQSTYATDFKKSEQVRIFRKNHPDFTIVIQNLLDSYKHTDQTKKINNILSKLKEPASD
ncbi:tetratricopeptide repeat protein, partial [Candidatus Peregrinibacteria bacterium]|nr:tetratricopeptide repeat protein [Candidatus Peregrinibacteria bacterium]